MGGHCAGRSRGGEGEGQPARPQGRRALLPEYLDKLAGLEGEVAELDSTIKAATASDDEEDGDGEPAEDALSPAELKKLKSKLTATKKQLKAEKAAFADRLAAASDGA